MVDGGADTFYLNALEVLDGWPLDAPECVGIVIDHAEYQQLTGGDAWTLTPEAGALLAAAVVGVWVIGWAFRQFGALISSS